MALARGAIDILINNVGGAHPRVGGFLSITDEDWVSTMNLNLMAAVRMTRAVLPSMIAAGGGAIVTTSSVNAFLPDPAVLDYSASKAAVANFSKSLSKEVAQHNIRVNTVSPGPVSTALWLGKGGVAQTVAGRPVGILPPSHNKPPRMRRPAASPLPKRWRTSWYSWPVLVRPMSPEPTSPSTEG